MQNVPRGDVMPWSKAVMKQDAIAARPHSYSNNVGIIELSLKERGSSHQQMR